MRKVYSLLFFFLALNVYSISVNLQMDSKVAYKGVPFNVTVVVSGLENVSGTFSFRVNSYFSVQRAGVSQNYSVQIANGKIKRIFVFGENFSLLPKRIGRFIIGPGVFKYKGKTYRTRKVSILVKSQATYRKLMQQRQQRQRGFFSDFFNSRQRVRESAKELKFFGEYSLSKNSCFVNQEVVLNLDLYVNIDRVRLVETANRTLAGFWEDKMNESAISDPVEVKKNGKTWFRYRKVLAHLYPTSPGVKTIPPVKAIFAMGMRRRYLKMEPISLLVKKLPASNVKNFRGDVGEYKISMKILTDKYYKNQPFEVDLYVVGKGNIGSLSDPSVEIISNSFRILSPRGTVNINHDKETVGPEVIKRFRYTVYPLKVGQIKLPVFKLVIFNPEKVKYQEIKTDKMVVEVLPDINAQSGDDKSTKINIENKIKYQVYSGEVNSAMLFASPLFIVVIYSVLSVTLLFLLYRYRRQMILSNNPTLLLKSRAYSEGSSAFSQADKEIKAGDFYTALGLIEKGLKKFILRKLGKEGDNILHSALKLELKSKGLPSDIIAELITLIDESSNLRYGMGANEDSVKLLFNQGKKTIKKVEQLWKS